MLNILFWKYPYPRFKKQIWGVRVGGVGMGSYAGPLRGFCDDSFGICQLLSEYTEKTLNTKSCPEADRGSIHHPGFD